MKILSFFNMIGFYIATVLSIAYVGFAIAESYSFRAMETAAYQQKTLRGEVAHAQQVNAFGQQFIKRVVVESFHEPALAELLKKRGMSITGPDGAKVNPGADAATPDASATPAPAPSSQP